MIEVTKTCVICKTEKTLDVNGEDYIRWQNGAPAKIAFPTMSQSNIELLINSVCAECVETLSIERDCTE